MGEWALLGHILGGFTLFAGMVLATAGWHLARTKSAPGEIALLLRLCRIGASMVAVATVVVLGLGLWLVDLQGRLLTDSWILWAISLLAVATAAGIAGGQRPKKARQLAERLSERDAPATSELRTLLDDRVSPLLNYAAAACILVIVFLMVFKPQ